MKREEQCARLPKQFLGKMKELLLEEYELYEKSYAKPRAHGLRVNTLKISVEEFLKLTPFALSPIPWTENGFYYTEKDEVTKHPHYFAGLYYVQEPSAMIPAAILPVKPGEKVLDLCAAPGGKATELGAKLERKGLLVANDISNSRAKGLLKNLEMFGVGNVLVTSETPERLRLYFSQFFDKILIDAPCSGEGMFRKDASMAVDWEKRGPSYYSKIQREILDSAADLVKAGGEIVYSTCTFSPEENEENIQFFLDQHHEFFIAQTEGEKKGLSSGRTEETGNEEMKKCVRIWPHKADGEGHFAVLLKKKEENSAQEKKEEKRKKEKQTTVFSKEAELFFQNVMLPALTDGTGIVTNYGGKLYLLPKQLGRIRGLRFLRTGLYLGEMEKNRFEPSQALAMYLKAEEYTQSFSMSAEDVRVRKYLKGETIEGEDCPYKKGWILICVDGYPLGWAKMVNGSLRNKYYAGWRIQ